MHPQSSSGFREIAHTADWELEVWAPDLITLLSQAARGMYQLTGMELSSKPRVSRLITLQKKDPETMLIDFLNELLYLVDSENLAFDHFDLQFKNDQLNGQVDGAKIASIQKEIKAATYHNLIINQTGQGLITKIVFDV
jgi:SHS2 domain-containing protein